VTFEPQRSRCLPGRVISPGVAFGFAYIDATLPLGAMPSTIAAEQVQAELVRLERARELVRIHLEDHVRGEHAPAQEDVEQVIAAHLLMLGDADFFGTIEERIKNQGLSADRAVTEAFSATASRMTATSDSYMSARAEDLRDICQTIRRALAYDARAFQQPEFGTAPTVYVVSHLRPSVVLSARREGAVGFATSSTALTSHGAILLRAAGIPALGGVSLQDLEIETGMPLLVDGVRGELTVHPQQDQVRAARGRISTHRLGSEDESLPPLDVELAGGESVSLFANIDHPAQVRLCFKHRLRGVGLFRTELLVSDHGIVPDEETQYRMFRDLAEALAGRPLVVRTFDFGAEKEPAGLQECLGRNPSLGIRGIRRHLHRFPVELRTQLKAVLRAAADADISVLLPMVTHAGDIRAVMAHLMDATEELKSQGIPFNGDIRVGAMLEIPSAALHTAELLEVVDFLSVGTNDLVQYLTAADRENPAVVDYHDVESSGLYRILEIVMETATAMGRQDDLSICGELASDPVVARDLVRLGFRSLSVTPHAADAVRESLRTWISHPAQEPEPTVNSYGSTSLTYDRRV
jgi:phosphotransferase system enzyme I (PtsI)